MYVSVRDTEKERWRNEGVQGRGEGTGLFSPMKNWSGGEISFGRKQKKKRKEKKILLCSAFFSTSPCISEFLKTCDYINTLSFFFFFFFFFHPSVQTSFPSKSDCWAPFLFQQLIFPSRICLFQTGHLSFFSVSPAPPPASPSSLPCIISAWCQSQLFTSPSFSWPSLSLTLCSLIACFLSSAATSFHFSCPSPFLPPVFIASIQWAWLLPF